MTEPSNEAKAWAESHELMPLYVFDEMSGNTDRVEARARKIALEAYDAGRKHERERLFRELIEWAEAKEEPNESAE